MRSRLPLRSPRKGACAAVLELLLAEAADVRSRLPLRPNTTGAFRYGVLNK